MNDSHIIPPPTSVDNKRVDWIDTAKAIGLFLVFLGHILCEGSPISDVVNRAIYSFHMPMYFLLSGFVLKQDLKPFKEFAKSRFSRILLPALILYILTLPIFFTPHYTDFSNANFWLILEKVFYIKGDCAYNLPIWFFICLFQIVLFVKWIDLANAKLNRIIIVLVASLLVSYFIHVSGTEYFKLFGFDKFVCGLFFYAFGMILKRMPYSNRMTIIGWMSFPIWIVISIILNSNVNMRGMVLGNFGYFVSAAILGSFSYFAFCKLLEKIVWIREYAKWTVFIVSSHFVFVTLFFAISMFLSFRGSFIYDITGLLYVLLILALYKPICKIIDKRLPIITGNNNAKNNKWNR